MTIQNYTFFSPNGTEFPVSANADAKLYQMLSGMGLPDFRRKDWETPINTALNRQYVNTSLVVGGRYFELKNETVNLNPSASNFVHANIDLTNTTNPVSLSVEAADNSNAIDINNGSGVLKKLIETVVTDSMGVSSVTAPPQNLTVAGNLTTQTLNLTTTSPWQDISKSGAFNGSAPQIKPVLNSIVYLNFSLQNQNQLPYNTPVTIGSTSVYRPSKTQEFVVLVRIAGSYAVSRLLVQTDGNIRLVPGAVIPANSSFSLTVSYTLN